MEQMVTLTSRLAHIIDYLGRQAQATGVEGVKDIVRSEGIRCIAAHIHHESDFSASCVSLDSALHSELLTALTDQQLCQIIPDLTNLYAAVCALNVKATCELIRRLTHNKHLPKIIQKASDTLNDVTSQKLLGLLDRIGEFALLQPHHQRVLSDREKVSDSGDNQTIIDIQRNVLRAVPKKISPTELVSDLRTILMKNLSHHARDNTALRRAEREYILKCDPLGSNLKLESSPTRGMSLFIPPTCPVNEVKDSIGEMKSRLLAMFDGEERKQVEGVVHNSFSMGDEAGIGGFIAIAPFLEQGQRDELVQLFTRKKCSQQYIDFGAELRIFLRYCNKAQQKKVLSAWRKSEKIMRLIRQPVDFFCLYPYLNTEERNRLKIRIRYAGRFDKDQNEEDSMLYEKPTKLQRQEIQKYLTERIKQMYQKAKNLAAAKPHITYLLANDPANKMVNQWIRKLARLEVETARAFIKRTLGDGLVATLFEAKVVSRKRCLQKTQKFDWDTFRQLLSTSFSHISHETHASLLWFGEEWLGEGRRYDLAAMCCECLLKRNPHHLLAFQRYVRHNRKLGQYQSILNSIQAFVTSEGNEMLSHSVGGIVPAKDAIRCISDLVNKGDFDVARKLTAGYPLLQEITKDVISAHQIVNFAEIPLKQFANHPIKLPRKLRKLSKSNLPSELPCEKALFHQNLSIRDHAKKQVKTQRLYTMGFLYSIVSQHTKMIQYLEVALAHDKHEQNKQNISEDIARRKVALLQLGKAYYIAACHLKTTDPQQAQYNFEKASNLYQEASAITVTQKKIKVCIPENMYDEHCTSDRNVFAYFYTQHNKNHYWWYQSATEWLQHIRNTSTSHASFVAGHPFFWKPPGASTRKHTSLNQEGDRQLLKRGRF